MAEFDDHALCPRSFFSSLMDDDDVSSSAVLEPTSENKSAPFTMGMQQQIAPVDQMANSGAPSDQNTGSRGGLLERMAARTGFNAPRLNTESIRPPDLMQNQELVSSYLLSPGLSPTTFLDSPIFLSNSMVQPSPTTGKFPFPPSGHSWFPSLPMDGLDKGQDNFFDNMNALSFTFKPIEESRPSQFLGEASRSTPSASASGLPQQAFPNIEVPVHSENSHLPQSDDPSKETGGGRAVEQSPLDEQEDEDVEQRGGADVTNGGTAPADDGYNWRKYGQKQVKGSEYPRSYYKCTQPNCPVKKKVERSHEGHITEIIYQSAHNHPKPPPNRRSAVGSSSALVDMQSDSAEQAGTGGDGDPAWSAVQRAGVDWKNENFEVTSSAAQMGSEPPTSLHRGGTPFETGDTTVDGSSTFSNDEEEDDRGTGSVSLGYDGEGDESESKRRKFENYPTEMSGATRAIREPRVVVQTTSEVDILDDGYRWRKYGQKVVKGNPNPRSYYKCTSTGCNVRKHVERASHDLKSVITTYEGKHNHEVPAARNSSHVNSGASTQSTSSVQGMILGTRHRSEPSQIHNMSRFDQRPPAFGSFSLPRRPHLGPPTQGYGFGLSQHGLTSFSRAGLGPNQGKLPVVIPVHQYLGQDHPTNDMVIMLPKGEPKEEPMSDPGLNISSNSAVYSQIMSRFPLGPQI